MIARTETFGECKVLHVGGRIDFESSLDFEQQVNSMIQSGGDRFIIELSEVELLSSAGLRVLLSTAKRVQHRHAQLALASPSQVVLQVFRISHFDLLFKIFATLPDALAAFGISAAPAENYSGATAKVVGGAPSAKPAEDRPVEATAPPRGEPAAEREALQPTGSSVRARPPPMSRPSPPVATGRLEDLPKGESVRSLAEAKTAVPPPLPVSGRDADERVPANGVTPPPVPAAISDARSRREASYPAVLEIRAEGISYPCKDGDVIGTAGRVASSFFASIAGVEARHLLIGQEGDHWFVFTPKNIAHPFVLDGVPLVAGERKFLHYVEHQMEFSGRVFGLRLIPDRRKKGLFGRFLK